VEVNRTYAFGEVKILKDKVMGPGHSFVALIGSGFGKFPLKRPNCSIFSLWIKKSHRIGSKNTQATAGLASYLLLFKSMLIGSGQGPPLKDIIKKHFTF